VYATRLIAASTPITTITTRSSTMVKADWGLGDGVWGLGDGKWEIGVGEGLEFEE